ncbi:Signal transduction histidine kinase [Filimonas lacunae]|uniref:histidine kinase n=1 Tax=Filimonas lacunae TaxID=477680 RepID=A0A173MBE3_9BACT|nr:HAMP domain-containing sensor histidine kinase [Filimonas lacunae]BAV04830.1 two-component sensor histidine kinase [Filimonas lacunae]SIT34694.1 Signal transduction histidine kinase [Filimonas lacunae]
MTSAISSAVNTLWQKAIGSPEQFSLESRIFHSFSMFAFCILGFETLFNLLLHLTPSIFITASVLTIQIALYYVSRVKGRLQLAVLVSIIEINILTCLNYKYESGITGHALLLFATSLFMILCVAKKLYWKIGLAVNVLIVGSLILWEYYHPGSIVPYNSRLNMVLSNGIAYVALAILLYAGFSYILGSYNHQRQLTEKKAQEFKQLNAEKDKLLSIISHDIRGPLSAIQQYFGILSETEMGQPEREALEEHLQQTIANTQELVTNVLSWTRSQLKGHRVALHRLELARELQKTIALSRLLAQRKGIQLEVVIDSRIVVTADTDMLQLVIRNLLNNAVKFSNAGTQVTLQGSVGKKGLCTISIKDDGIGIAADKQQYIFTLNVKSTYGTSNEKGSGIGLALCREFMQLQNGDIFFTSTQGKGSVFYVTLPGEPI